MNYTYRQLECKKCGMAQVTIRVGKNKYECLNCDSKITAEDYKVLKTWN
jgi:ribosomal protein L37AE/L43A